MRRPLKPLYFIIKLLTVAAIAFTINCDTKNKPAQSPKSAVWEIIGAQSIKDIIDTSGNRLIMFDLYADWCLPCRILSPLLETIATEHPGRVSMYKINIDKNPDIAESFGVTGIPFVVLIKNKTTVQAFTGVQPKDAYVRAILQYGVQEEKPAEDRPDGELVNGIRVIKITTATSPGNIYVYRGEEVKIVVEKVDIPYSVHIPAFKIDKTATIGKDLEVEFKAVETGVSPFFCNGNCPVGDRGSRVYGQCGQGGVQKREREKSHGNHQERKPLDS
jgi:thioredoxin 1